MMKRIIVLCFVFASRATYAQDMQQVHHWIDTLTSKTFWGRGYTNNGNALAGTYLASEFKRMGLTPMKGKRYEQKFKLNVNTFPDTMEVTINNKKLIPGLDYIVEAHSNFIKANGGLIELRKNIYTAKGYFLDIILEDKLTGDVARTSRNITTIEIDKSRFAEKPETFNVHINNKMLWNYKSNNICGIAKGTKFPDSVIVFSAHYDHLGGLGFNTYFPGANDNASGTTMLLALAEYFAKHPPTYSIGFILFSGEELGLLGSKYFVNHPLIRLKKIKFLVNLDMVGTGDEGITVVNATEFKNEFKLLNTINDSTHLLPKIYSRGKAANSDHHLFTEAGVPSFFIYTLGGIQAYHDVFDKASTLPLTAFIPLHELLIDFASGLMGTAH